MIPAMSFSAERTLLRDRLFLLILGAVLFFPGLGNHDLWNPDEPRYTEVAREMVLSGDYFVPHLNGEVYTQKPPLLFWLIRLASTVTGGLGPTAARLPSAFAALLAVLLTFEIGRRLFNARTALLSAVVFATCLKIPIQARTGQIDMLLTSLVALAVFFWVRGYTEGRPGFYRLFFLATGFATLAKGPVGLLPPLLSIVAYLLLVKERGEIRKLGIGLGLLIWAAIVLAWLVPAGFEAGWGYLQQIVFKQNVTRYVDPWHHRKPFYYYLTVIVGDFLPWSFVLPAALVAGFRTLEGKARKHFLFAVCWTVVTVVFFSLSPAKRSVYILTMYPGMSLALAAGFEGLREVWPRFRWWLLGPLGFVALVLAIASALLPSVGAKRPEAAILYDGYLLWAAGAVGLLAVTVAVAVVLARRRRLFGTVTALAAGASVFSLLATLVLMPPFDLMKSARPLSEELNERIAPGEPFALYPRIEPPFLFYTERFADILSTEEELRAYAERPGRVWVIAERLELEKIETPLPYVEVARDTDPTEGYVLLQSSP